MKTQISLISPISYCNGLTGYFFAIPTGRDFVALSGIFGILLGCGLIILFLLPVQAVCPTGGYYTIMFGKKQLSSCHQLARMGTNF